MTHPLTLPESSPNVGFPSPSDLIPSYAWKKKNIKKPFRLFFSFRSRSLYFVPQQAAPRLIKPPLMERVTTQHEEEAASSWRQWRESGGCKDDGKKKSTSSSSALFVPAPETVTCILLSPLLLCRSASVPLGLPIFFIILCLCPIDAAISPLGASPWWTMMWYWTRVHHLATPPSFAWLWAAWMFAHHGITACSSGESCSRWAQRKENKRNKIFQKCVRATVITQLGRAAIRIQRADRYEILSAAAKEFALQAV